MKAISSCGDRISRSPLYQKACEYGPVTFIALTAIALLVTGLLTYFAISPFNVLSGTAGISFMGLGGALTGWACLELYLIYRNQNTKPPIKLSKGGIPILDSENYTKGPLNKVRENEYFVCRFNDSTFIAYKEDGCPFRHRYTNTLQPKLSTTIPYAQALQNMKNTKKLVTLEVLLSR